MSKKHRKKASGNQPASTPVKKPTPAQGVKAPGKRPVPAQNTKAQPPAVTPPASRPVSENAKKPFPIKTVALAAVMVICVAAGAWFALSPMLEKNKALEQQSALLDSIEQGDGEIVLDAAVVAAEVDFYDNDDETPEPDTTTGLAATETSAATETPEATETAAPVDTVITGIGILTIEAIDAKLPVTDGVTNAQLKVAVGHVRGTPEIGAAGNSVIAGHRSYTYGQFFNRLGEVKIGDIIKYQTKDGEIMEFLVYEILDVEPGDPAVLHQPEDKNIITLLTCTPIRTATHRLLVRAELIN